MDFKNLAQTVKQYVNKLENNFIKENYEVDFVLKKLDNYVQAVHQEIIYDLTDELGVNVDSDNLEIVENRIQKPYVEAFNPFREKDIEMHIKIIFARVETFVESYRTNNGNFNDYLSIFPIALPNKNEVNQLIELLHREIEQKFKISVKNSKLEKYLNQIADDIAKGDFRDRNRWNKMLEMNKKNIISEVTAILNDQRKLKKISEICSKYREYLLRCIEEYQKEYQRQYQNKNETDQEKEKQILKCTGIHIECQNSSFIENLTIGNVIDNTISKINNQKETTAINESISLSEITYKKFSAEKRIINTIEITYNNGQKRRVSFEKIYDQVDVNFIEQKLNEITRMGKELDNL